METAGNTVNEIVPPVATLDSQVVALKRQFR